MARFPRKEKTAKSAILDSLMLNFLTLCTLQTFVALDCAKCRELLSKGLLQDIFRKQNVGFVRGFVIKKISS